MARLSIRDGVVIADLRLGRPDARLRTGDSIRLRFHGIFGDRLLDVVPGPREAPLLEPGDTLVASIQPAPTPEAIDAVIRAILRDSSLLGALRAPPRD